jgi:hypothetical protein
VQLVQEEDDVARLPRLVDHGLEALLELAAVLAPATSPARSSASRRVPRSESGHVAGGDALGEALHDRRLAGAGVAHQHGLFLVRRRSVCARLRVSASRPTTGGSFPSRAAAVRSREKRPSAPPSGVRVAVGGLHDLGESSAAAMRSGVQPLSRSGAARGPPAAAWADFQRAHGVPAAAVRQRVGGVEQIAERAPGDGLPPRLQAHALRAGGGALHGGAGGRGVQAQARCQVRQRAAGIQQRQ